jgi:hypothetical protein
MLIAPASHPQVPRLLEIRHAAWDGSGYLEMIKQ